MSIDDQAEAAQVNAQRLKTYMSGLNADDMDNLRTAGQLQTAQNQLGTAQNQLALQGAGQAAATQSAQQQLAEAQAKGGIANVPYDTAKQRVLDIMAPQIAAANIQGHINQAKAQSNLFRGLTPLQKQQVITDRMRTTGESVQQATQSLMQPQSTAQSPNVPSLYNIGVPGLGSAPQGLGANVGNSVPQAVVTSTSPQQTTSAVSTSAQPVAPSQTSAQPVASSQKISEQITNKTPVNADQAQFNLQDREQQEINNIQKANPKLYDRVVGATTAAVTLQKLKQLAPDIAKYSGPEGAIKLNYDNLVGSNDPDFLKYQSAQQNVSLLADQLRKQIAGSISPEMNKQLQNIVYRSGYTISPESNINMLNNAADLFHRENQVYYNQVPGYMDWLKTHNPDSYKAVLQEGDPVHVLPPKSNKNVLTMDDLDKISGAK